MSVDGDLVAFHGIAGNVWDSSTLRLGQFKQVFVRDVRNPANKATFRASSAASDGDSRSASVSLFDELPTRLGVAFSSLISETGLPAGVEDIFLADLDLESGSVLSIEKISVSGATDGNANSIVPMLSRGGNFVAFASDATNLVTGDTNGDRDVFLKRLSLEVMRRSSVKTDGGEPNTTGIVESTSPDLTENGYAVVFESTQADLVPGDTNDQRDVFRRNEPFLKKFRRADSDNNGTVNLTDAVFTLGYLFLGTMEPRCLDAADANDSGAVDITDAVYTLNHLFLGGPPPPAPGPQTCGTDPTADSVTCNSSSCPQT